jgi:hypothetical protein
MLSMLFTNHLDDPSADEFLANLARSRDEPIPVIKLALKKWGGGSAHAAGDPLFVLLDYMLKRHKDGSGSRPLSTHAYTSVDLLAYLNVCDANPQWGGGRNLFPDGARILHIFMSAPLPTPQTLLRAPQPPPAAPIRRSVLSASFTLLVEQTMRSDYGFD